MKLLITVTLWLGLLMMSLLYSVPAYATLGEKATSIERDRRALAGAKGTTTTGGNYTVQEVTYDAATVREFLTPSGVVFAVAWNGLAPPDLATLLGSYHAQYKTAKQLTPRKHGQRNSKVVSDGVTVETWGHMRNLQGRAYLPSLIPAGVNLNEIR